MARACLAGILLLAIYTAQALLPAEIREIQESNAWINPKKFLLTKFHSDRNDESQPAESVSISTSGKLTGGDTGSLTVTPTIVSSDTEWITVSWSNISYTGKYDWIGLFNASAGAESYAAPPLKFQYVCPAVDHCYYAPASGSLKFKVLNRRTDYIFAYITESNPYREIKGVSSVVTYNEKDLYMPMNVHIAAPMSSSSAATANCGKTASCMQIMWVQKAVSSPMLKYGVSANDLNKVVSVVNVSKLSPEDLCDQQYGLPAGTTGYFDTGYMITVSLLELTPNTQYFYQVGEDAYGWTQTFNFSAPPKYGEMTPRDDIKLIIFGDLGNVAIDYSMHHSWDFGNQGEIYSINTTHAINLFTNGSKDVTDALIHIGDISYAVGFMSEWDDFFHQIEPVSAHIPWMTGMGNHEYSWTGEWKPPSVDVSTDAYGNADGGGECGVPYNFYFPFANNNEQESRANVYDPTVVEPWYVFDYGMVRSIIMSTEHDFGVDSKQYQFIENVFKTTDRTLFPWIFIAGHRPMYANDDWDGDTTTSEYLRETLEDMMYANKVALGFWGHQHSYGRTCSVYQGECVKDGESAVHLIVGMAGYSLSKSIQPMNYTVFQNNTIYGFVHLTVHNDTVMSGKFIDANTTNVVDSFTVYNPYTYKG
eukprot:CAMPEP_0197035980 /NCGR_PEP_ID=MMETSP1384-20130603/13617_1 /TAXON_ID=29189 /ORGANISM="Ammonia sp." /LENGTH=647 /DNA_ID=CAMNT_0042466099 /DNA_START=33 /DNA_END=1976 /DNA_ORIENTATION=+